MIPRYAEISHYRAPYKDGMMGCGFGSVTDQPTISDAAKAATEVKNGLRYWKADVASRVLTNFDSLNTGLEFVGRGKDGVDRPGLVIGTGAENIGAWVKDGLDAGFMILATEAVIFPGGGVAILAAVETSLPQEGLLASSTEQAPVLAYPGMVLTPPPTCPTGQVLVNGQCMAQTASGSGAGGGWWSQQKLSTQLLVIGGTGAFLLAAYAVATRSKRRFAKNAYRSVRRHRRHGR